MTPIYAQSTPREKYLFHVFCTETALRQEPGSDSFEGTFWSVDVPQACHAHPAVWHSALAIASMQTRPRAVCTRGHGAAQPCADDDAAFKQYTKAIGHLMRATQNTHPSFQDQSLILMATVLLLGFASLRGNFNEVKFFAGHGIRLFTNWRFRDEAETWKSSARSNLISVTSLISLLDHLLVQYTWACKASDLPRQAYTTSAAPKRPFQSMTEAHHEYQALQLHRFELLRARALGSVTGDWRPFRYFHEAWLARSSAWKDKLAQTRRQSEHQGDDAPLRPSLILQMGLVGLQICAQVGPGTDELYWDRFASKFRRIVDIAERIFHGKTDSRGQRPARPVFTFGPSQLGVLYMVASACRERATRARTLALLQGLKQRDGLLDSGLFAALSEAKMRIEETGRELVGLAEPKTCTCIPREYICRHHRVRDVGIEFLDSGLARLDIQTFDGDDAQAPRTKSLTVRWNGS
ncbi:uncharacterized protein MAM_07175 [Metarhizium album ARSEF 1941]|uniref:C6 zinc finger domain protein n=1 Tax=Metarhizium album (strain ARSEF 1941) TaxID=1081103 RepID=A0A0B2WLY0_METAS|nr:uncharacterized protein MAM_07175 [Metarhizium album ARSEF 1941]KHN94948.1 hypothetical protein MAM_07175 [Metarhizium album ARSEF 1941]